MIDPARYAADGLLTGLDVLPEGQARRIGRHVLKRRDRAEPLLHALASQPGLLAPVSMVLGADLMVRNADVFIKLPGCEGRIDWHLDSAIPWPAIGRLANLWVALSDSGPASGGVSYLPGHHTRPLSGGPADRDHLTLTPQARATLPLSAAICPTLRPGQATLHAFSTPHRSGANRTQAPRIGVVFRYMAAGTDPQVAESGQGFLVQGRATGRIATRDDFTIGWHIMK